MKEDIIVSISTPIGKGAISLVRMSGHDCLSLAQTFFAPFKKTQTINPRYMYFGKLEIQENVFEECLMVFFKNPFSYTGEDLVEFHIHGGVLLAQKVLEKIIKSGARLAEAGEFSKRAFANGKITLDKAEAIIGEINAETEAELKSSLQITNGRLAKEISDMQEDLKTILAELEVNLDYPDEEEETRLENDIKGKLGSMQKKLEDLLETAISGKILKNGINVALVGKANVGKSSVMNALLGQDRAIVTDIQGTTRDSITESFVTDGVKINLIDTAGIRETQDLVESIGIEKSKESLQIADLVLFVIDGSEDLTDEDESIKKLLDGKKVLHVINKSDKKRKLSFQENEIEISALEGKNIKLLKSTIVKTVLTKNIDTNALMLTNERHVGILQESEKILTDILQNKEISLDIVAMQIKQLWKTLGKITGNTENEDIIDLIFSKFCLGK